MRRGIAMALGGVRSVGRATLELQIGRGGFDARAHVEPVEPMDLAPFAASPPERLHRAIFIHHSCGGQLLAPEGPDRDRPNGGCIYESHPNGGGLRAMLRGNGYEVHDLAYNSRLGVRTDIFDWLPKFRDHMDQLLAIDDQDQLYEDNRRNDIVIFKSCFPNNLLVGRGTTPGNPSGPELTVENVKATLRALLPAFACKPQVLFVYVTAPALAPWTDGAPLYRVALDSLRGRRSPLTIARESGPLARELNDWVVGRDGWLADYPQRNVVVFDYYGALTGDASDFSAFSASESDSHPSAEGNRRAAQAFVPLLNRAVRRAGLEPAATAVAIR